MASIAYITDKKMIEYHRLNGNHSINFWKPSNTKKSVIFIMVICYFFWRRVLKKEKIKKKV